MMTGVLETTIAPRPPAAMIEPPTPWWWGNDDDASTANMQAIQALGSVRQRKR